MGFGFFRRSPAPAPPAPAARAEAFNRAKYLEQEERLRRAYKEVAKAEKAWMNSVKSNNQNAKALAVQYKQKLSIAQKAYTNVSATAKAYRIKYWENIKKNSNLNSLKLSEKWGPASTVNSWWHVPGKNRVNSTWPNNNNR